MPSESLFSRCRNTRRARSPAYVSEFVSSSDGLRLIKAFTRIESGVRRRIVDLVQEIAAADGE